MRKYQV